jgi:hypothetical protein
MTITKGVRHAPTEEFAAEEAGRAGPSVVDMRFPLVVLLGSSHFWSRCRGSTSRASLAKLMHPHENPNAVDGQDLALQHCKLKRSDLTI